MRKHPGLIISFCSLLLLLVIGGPISAAAAGPGLSGSVAQSYSADSSVVQGMVVELNPKTQLAIPLTAKDIRNMLGVVVPTDDAAIVLTPQSSAAAKQVLIAGSGRYNLLVSNQNGPVKTGDYLTVSALPGISMKAGTEQAEIIGRAAGSFNGTSHAIATVPLKNAAGRASTVAIGQAAADVHLASNPLFEKNNLPGFLNKAANKVANKPGSIRIYLSSAVLLATIIISGFMFYGSVRSSIMATGRNPLAKKEIGRNLAQAIVSGMAIFLAGILAAYLILL
jgi:hypothetical protein